MDENDGDAARMATWYLDSRTALICDEGMHPIFCSKRAISYRPLPPKLVPESFERVEKEVSYNGDSVSINEHSVKVVPISKSIEKQTYRVDNRVLRISEDTAEIDFYINRMIKHYYPNVSEADRIKAWTAQRYLYKYHLEMLQDMMLTGFKLNLPLPL